jgi:uncharacterized membrane protein
MMRILLLLLAMLASAAFAETVLYRADWSAGVDRWTAAGAEAQGGALSFAAGTATCPPVAVEGAHVLRIRYSYRKSHDGLLTGTALQYDAGTAPRKRTVLQNATAPFPNPMTQEAVLFVEEGSTGVAYAFELAGPGRVTLASFEIVDLGPPPAEVDRKELLVNPGWEACTPGQAFPAENSYSQGWMGWGLPATIVCTGLPERVHGGKTAVLLRPQGDVSLGHSGFRSPVSIPTKPVAWYDFSVWAKGEGTIQLHAVAQMACDTVLLSPQEWRQVHMVYPADNSTRTAFSVGVLVNGRVCIDDLSVTQVPYREVAALRAANARWSRQPIVAQTVPAGETRTADPVTLENAHLKALLSPQGGGRIIALTDKDSGTTWTDASLLQLVFRGQPVPINWNLPFRTERSGDGRTVTFSHTVTGGAQAPFLDGVRVEHIYRLGADDRRLTVTYRLTNTSDGTRLPSLAVENHWPAAAGVTRVSAAGEEGVLAAEGAAKRTWNLTAGWMAASTAAASLVWGFDVAAVREGLLDPVKGSAGWSYLSPTLAPGGAWETSAWVAPAALAAVDYADARVAVRARLTPQGESFTLALQSVALGAEPATVSARVTQYDGTTLVAGAGPLAFTPPGRFITGLEIAAGGQRSRVELFNDPRNESGISGSNVLQYRPPVPVRVLRLPDIGDRRAAIRQSMRVLWVFGLYSQYYPFDLLLPALGYAAAKVEPGGMPEEVEELLAYRAVILSNVGAAQLTAEARAALAQYVRAGGGLLVLGSSSSLGNAQTTGTDLEALLPATLTGPFDTRLLAGTAQLLKPAAKSGLGGLAWPEQPRLYWLHQVAPKPGTTVLLTAGDRPVLLEAPSGLGRTLLFAGTVEGDPPPTQRAAWTWSGWGELWGLVLGRVVR